MSASTISIGCCSEVHPSQLFILGIKHPTVIKYILFCSIQDCDMLDGLVNMFRKTKRENTGQYDISSIHNKLLEDIIKARTNLMYLRDNVDELDFADNMFNEMNNIGTRFDNIEYNLSKC
jgi:hypothetical protein